MARIHIAVQFLTAYHISAHPTQVAVCGIVAGEHGKEEEPFATVAWE
jgi:hypothetical protein